MLRRFLCWLIISGTAVYLGAQTPVFRLRTSRELANVSMTAVAQDSRGWLWFGAADGLYRYDGLVFQSVARPDGVAASVTALFEWQGRMWAGFADGSIGFISVASPFRQAGSDQQASSKKKAAARLQLWAPEEGLPRQAIRAFAADALGGFWIATYGEGLYCLKNKRLYQFNAADDGLSDDEVYALACDGKGRVWAATDGGISICSMPVAGKKTVQKLHTRDGLPDELVTALLADRAGNIWIGMQEKGVCHYDIQASRFDFSTAAWPFGMVTSLALFEKTELWVGTLGEGMLRVPLPEGTVAPLPDGHPLRHVKTQALCKDREGLLWSVCENGRVYSAQTRFSLLETGIGSAQSVLIDRRNRIWAGSSEGLFLQKIKPQGEQPEFVPVLPRPENVISLWESPADGVIWAGTFGNGVYLLHPDGSVLRHLTEKDGLSNGSVLSIAGDAERVWLASLGGVAVLDPRALLQNSRQNELGSSYVYKVFLDSRQRVWFCTDGQGLICLENGQYRRFQQAGQVELKTIYSIAEDRRGNIWFSTDRDGLFCFNGKAFRRYTLDNHLHSLDIIGLAVDGNGQLVVAYDDGFDLLNPERVDHIVFCDAAIGAPPVEVNLNALCTDAAGQVWMGTRQGILRSAAFPEPFLDDPQPGITTVSLFGETIDFLNNTRFQHDQNYFIFNFTGLWYTDPESVRYRYHLDGVDLEWKVSKDPLASYPKLPPGHYTFRVQTSEHGNFDHVPEARWEFTILPPFWTRWWFVGLCVLAGVGLFYAFVRNREQRLRRLARLQRDQVEAQFAALKSQINPHFLFNSFNTLITTIEENPKLAVEYVEHLSDFYRSIIAYREKDFISLEEEMALVRDFEFLLKKRYEDGIQVEHRLNGKTGMIMPLALQMLVENAVKHNVISASRPLTIEIFTESSDYVVVRNNIQARLRPEPSTHFGLQSLINRYRLLGEKPVLVEDNAAFFTVKIPIRK